MLTVKGNAGTKRHFPAYERIVERRLYGLLLRLQLTAKEALFLVEVSLAFTQDGILSRFSFGRSWWLSGWFICFHMCTHFTDSCGWAGGPISAEYRVPSAQHWEDSGTRRCFRWVQVWGGLMLLGWNIGPHCKVVVSIFLHFAWRWVFHLSCSTIKNNNHQSVNSFPLILRLLLLGRMGATLFSLAFLLLCNFSLASCRCPPPPPQCTYPQGTCCCKIEALPASENDSQVWAVREHLLRHVPESLLFPLLQSTYFFPHPSLTPI